MDSKKYNTPVKRILLMYITEISGHHRASVAISQALEKIYPDVEIRKINGFGYVYPVIEKIVNKTYMGVIRATPQLWDYLYDNPRIVRKTKGIKEFIHKNTHKKIGRLFDDFQPDAVICTQAFPCGLVADYKLSRRLDITVVGVLTDYAPHAYWVHEGIDYYVVPSQEAKERFVLKGINEKMIKVFGIPVDPKFSRSLDRVAIAEDLGLDPENPVILVMGGGQGLGPIKKIVAGLVRVPRNIQIVVLAGTNRKLIRFLRRVQKRKLKKLVFFEYTDKVDELMELAELAITKPGGMTTTEALTKGLPMVIIRPIPGQEMHNMQYLLKHQVAVHVDHINRIGKIIMGLLDEPDRIRAMSERAKAISKPNSSIDIARLVLQRQTANV